ncbi:hypothetical protein EON65_29215 [archaeon]|nr:MAG: hypothetical protein EON65_29215 [archaeon]
MTENLECTCTVLLAGLNGTGHSTLLSIEKKVRAEKKILNRILINVGDGTQRLCQEHRIKLASISTIIITSLAPHNISGFPGIFLALSNLVSPLIY